MSNPTVDFNRDVRQALKDGQLQRSLHRLESGLQAKRRRAIGHFSDYEAARSQAEQIKRDAIEHLPTYLEAFEARVIERGGQVHWARDAREAQEKIHAICVKRGAKHIAKSKSMVSEEIMLNQFLESVGFKVVETDLGEYILQLRREAPSHIVVPAFHLSQQDVADTFFDKHADQPSTRSLEEIEALLQEARETLRPVFLNADVGITGANFLVAETGSVVVVSNEGNADLVQVLPKTHIVVAGIEKIVPSLADIDSLLRLLSRSATGQDATAYTTVTTGLPQPDQFDGPDEFHIVLLDNGRSKLVGTENQSLLYCIRCGACMNHCPVYGAVGGHAYHWTYPGPLGSALNPGLFGLAKTHHLPNASTFCGRCESVCPVKIPLVRIMRNWRISATTQGISSKWERLLSALWTGCVLRPNLYHFLSRIAIRLLALANRGRAPFLFPFFYAWMKHRDLPSPEGKTFTEIWGKKNRKGHRG